MAIWRRCSKRACKNPRRRLEHLWFDVTHRGTRFRVPVNEFAIPRMDPKKQRPIASLEEARDWERVFIGEIKAGRDPRRPRPVQKSSDTAPKDVAGFLDTYVERCVKPAALKSVNSTCSRIAVLKEHLGKLPLDALEEADEINRFKSESDYAKRVELATIHRTLETLRAAVDWGMAQTPPLFRKSPFHRFGVRTNKKGETVRDRRLSREEEKKLLDAALQKMNTPGASIRRTAAPRSHHRRAGAVLPARRDAADPEQARQLGDASDRHPWCDGQGQGESANSVQSEGTARRHPRPSIDARSGRVRVRNRRRRVPAGTANGLGNTSDCWLTASNRDRRGKVRRGIVSSFSGSISAGTTSGTKVPADYWPTAWTSASSN